MSGSDTIFALASGFGRAAVSVLRISGPAAGAALDRLARSRPAPRRAALRRLRDEAGETIDTALVLWMPGPTTATGEDTVELHLHGGSAIRAAALRALAHLPSFRAAEPGEFTRRAFLNGRLDLTAAEGLADLIDAETEAQRRQAQRQLDGALAQPVESWRDELLDVMAALDAALDFADEGDVPADVTQGLLGRMERVRIAVAAALAGAERGERIRDGFTVVIAGPPNAGKSTLLNALAGREAAIVSSRPGTTRDAIEVRCDLRGLPVTMVDTAGIRETDDEVEQAGIARAHAYARKADLVVWLDDPTDPTGSAPVESGAALLRVSAKADLGIGGHGALAVSGRTGEGVDALLDAITARVEGTLATGAEPIVTRERHRRILLDMTQALDRAMTNLSAELDDLAAEDIRLALRALGRITGAVDVEDVLDRIFSRFCIGK